MVLHPQPMRSVQVSSDFFFSSFDDINWRQPLIFVGLGERVCIALMDVYHVELLPLKCQERCISVASADIDRDRASDLKLGLYLCPAKSPFYRWSALKKERIITRQSIHLLNK